MLTDSEKQLVIFKAVKIASELKYLYRSQFLGLLANAANESGIASDLITKEVAEELSPALVKALREMGM